MRLVINVVEKDLRRITQGTAVAIEVDAFPGEVFNGRVARVAPILDPATRTAQVEIEIPNATYRLKPGMYARARFTVEKHDNALVVPTPAIVDLQGKIGVWLPEGEGTGTVFNPVTIGIEQQEFTEVATGLKEGQQIISTGAAALRPGDKIALAGPARRRRAPRRRRAARRAAAARAHSTDANRGQQRGQQGAAMTSRPAGR